MAWTHETEEGRLKVLVTRSDPVAGTIAVTEEQAIPRAPLTGTTAERRYIERKWRKRLWKTMPRVQMRKNCLIIRAVEHAAKRQCWLRAEQMPDEGAAGQGGRTCLTL